MPDLRPNAAETAASPMGAAPDKQLEHQFRGGELLAKVFPGGEPLVVTAWTCPTCGLSVRGAPPRRCINDPATTGCPVEPAP